MWENAYQHLKMRTYHENWNKNSFLEKNVLTYLEMECTYVWQCKWANCLPSDVTWYFLNRINDASKLLNGAQIDPLGQPTVTAGRDHYCFCTCCPSVPTFQNLAKQNKAKTLFATGETVGLAEWIIDDTCLVSFRADDFLYEYKIELIFLAYTLWRNFLN